MKSPLRYAILPLCLASILTGIASPSQKALYVYRNDQTVNTVFFSDLDSIAYSTLDLDSIDRDTPVTAEFWTPDTVYRIPVTAIDSIAFQPLPTIYRPDVTVIEGRLADCVTESDSNILILSAATPDNLIPRIGTRLVSTDGCPRLPYGFGGEVRKIDRTDSSIRLTCDILSPLDFMEQFCLSYDSNDSSSATPATLSSRSSRANADNADLFDIPLSIDFSRYITYTKDESIAFTPAKASFSTDLRLHAHSYKVTAMGRDGNIFISGRYIHDLHLDPKISICSAFSIEKPISLVKKSVPIPDIYFIELYFDSQASLNTSGTLCFDHTAGLTLRTHHDFTFSTDRNINSSYHIKPEVTRLEGSTDKIAGNINIEAGISLETGFRLTKVKIEGLDIDVKAYGNLSLGLGIDVDVPLYKPELENSNDTKLYRRIKQVSAPLNLYGFCRGDIGFKAGAGLSWGDNKDDNKDDNKLEIILLDASCRLFELKPTLWESPELFPTFNSPKFVANPAKSFASAGISGDLFFPTKVGYKILDNEGNEYASVEHPDEYRNGTDFQSYDIDIPLETSMLNRNLKLYPYCTVFGHPVLAEPVKDITLKCNAITKAAENIKSSTATINGQIESPVSLQSPGITTGFQYAESAAGLSSAAHTSVKADDDNTIKLQISKLKPNTTYYYRAFVRTGDTVDYGETLNFTTKDNNDEVDLGLSVKWRTKNLGADKESAYGNYYSWAATAPATSFTWDNYFDSPYDPTGDWAGCKEITTSITDDTRDAAAIELEDGWRLPTRTEMQELINNCTWSWDSVDGINGYTVTGPNGNSIFLPAAGTIDGSDMSNAGRYGGYWNSTISDSSSSMAGIMYFFESSMHSLQWSNRYIGRSIRPVKD